MIAPLVATPESAVPPRVTTVEHRLPPRRRESGLVDLSFVVPLKDESATIAELHARIAAQLVGGETYEVIFVDDGSSDGSWEAIEALVERDPQRVRGIRFRRNVGKAAALTAGFRAARGRVVFTLDADLQDDPKEIHRFLAKLDEGYDVVSGWKKVRHDPWHKVLPSRIFNRMLSRCSGVALHDHNCGFKAYRSEVAKGMTLFGELHRMVPAIAAMNGFRVGEIVVEHHARRHGVSKYGFERYLRGFTDMLVMGFLRKYRDRPAHFIAGVAVSCLLAALLLAGTGIVLLVAGASLAGIGAFVCGSVALATAVLAAVGALVAEIANRGGLRGGWSLPVIADTLTAAESPRSHMPAALPVVTTYAAED